MEQCETCINKKHSEELLCCCANKLGHALTELKRQIPVIGKHIAEHECSFYIDEADLI